MKITWNRGNVDVEWKGRRARFSGELGLEGFAADPDSMKWMTPKRDVPATFEEREEWVKAINDYYGNTKRSRVFFLNDCLFKEGRL